MKRFLLVAIAAWALLPSVAEASCRFGKPKERLAVASAAFVGTVVELDGDRITFAVEERFKGELPGRIELVDEAPRTSISLRPKVGERLALLLRETVGPGRAGAGQRLQSRRPTGPA